MRNPPHFSDRPAWVYPVTGTHWPSGLAFGRDVDLGGGPLDAPDVLPRGSMSSGRGPRAKEPSASTLIRREPRD